jgi:hypothetical protein
VLGPAQFFHAMRKWIFGQIFNSLDNALHHACGQLAEVLSRGLLPFNAKGHGASALS